MSSPAAIGTRRAILLAVLLALPAASSFSAPSIVFQKLPQTVRLPTSHRNDSFQNPQSTTNAGGRRRRPFVVTSLRAEAESAPTVPAPVLDGQRVLPLKIMKAGLKGHQVAAVYALLNSEYQRGYVPFFNGRSQRRERMEGKGTFVDGTFG